MVNNFYKNIVRDFFWFLGAVFILLLILGGLAYAESVLFGTSVIGFFLFVAALLPALGLAGTGHHIDETKFVIGIILTIIFYSIVLIGIFLIGRLVFKSLTDRIFRKS